MSLDAKKVPKLFLILSCLVFLFCAPSPVRGVSFLEELFETVHFAEEEKDFNIFSDPAFTQPTHNFSPGQTVYVKVEAPGSGDQEKTLRLLDHDKKEVLRLALTQSGSGPYIFTASFAAPSTPGVYYVDIKIRNGQGSVFSSQENINVGKNHVSGPVSSEAESTVYSEEEATPTIPPTSSPTPTPIPERPPPVSFIFQIIQFVRTLLSNLTGFFK